MNTPDTSVLAQTVWDLDGDEAVLVLLCFLGRLSDPYHEQTSRREVLEILGRCLSAIDSRREEEESNDQTLAAYSISSRSILPCLFHPDRYNSLPADRHGTRFLHY